MNAEIDFTNVYEIAKDAKKELLITMKKKKSNNLEGVFPQYLFCRQYLGFFQLKGFRDLEGSIL